MVNYSNHIVPENPLYLPELKQHLQAPKGAGTAARSGTTLPSRIQPIAPTDVQPGQLAEPVSPFGHADGGSEGRTGGQGDKFIHVQYHEGEPNYDTHVPPKPGKNFIPGYRAYLVSNDGSSRACVMSGMGQRVVINQSGQSASYGHAETVHFRSSSTAHLPSNHQLASRCLVSVSK
ncbi:MAG: hypothetical protein KAH11_08905 [Rhodospirillales bacterium]|nr:hypothetical protein [Rhodospirillales bacterium]